MSFFSVRLQLDGKEAILVPRTYRAGILRIVEGMPQCGHPEMSELVREEGKRLAV